MDCKRPYFSAFDKKASSQQVLAMLGAIARIRQYVSGRLPSRQDWVKDLDAFNAGSPAPTIIGAEQLLSKLFPLEAGAPKQQLRLSDYPIMADFIAHWLSDAPTEFQSDRARELLSQLELKGGVKRMLQGSTPGDAGAAKALVMGILTNVKNKPAPWADGLRLFDWPSVRTGFVAYEPIPRNDPRGLYLLVREARDWSTSPSGAPTLVRDLIWIRSRPGHAHDGSDGFKGVGRYYSCYNKVAYWLNNGAEAGKNWHRYQGPPIQDGQGEHRDMEILCPALQSISGGLPAFALMIAHTKNDQFPGVWKAIVQRIDNQVPGWSDIDSVEPELEMFGGSEHIEDTNVAALMHHVRARGLIGEFPDVDGEMSEARRYFRGLLLKQHPAGHLERAGEQLKRIAAAGSGDPIAAIEANWMDIEPSQIILPSSDDIFIAEDKAPWAMRRLFGRDAVGADQVAAGLAAIAETSAGAPAVDLLPQTAPNMPNIENEGV